MIILSVLSQCLFGSLLANVFFIPAPQVSVCV